MLKVIAIAVVLVLGFQWFQKNYVVEMTWDKEPFFDTDHGIISHQGKQALAAPSKDDGFAEFR